MPTCLQSDGSREVPIVELQVQALWNDQAHLQIGRRVIGTGDMEDHCRDHMRILWLKNRKSDQTQSTVHT